MPAEFDNIPTLDGWVNLTEAAEMIGITRQHAHKKARLANEGKANGWKSIRRVGSKPMYVVSIREIEDIIRKQDEPRSVATDLVSGTLAPQDREAWLRNYQLPTSTTDVEILMAMGPGLA